MTGKYVMIDGFSNCSDEFLEDIENYEKKGYILLPESFNIVPNTDLSTVDYEFFVLMKRKEDIISTDSKTSLKKDDDIWKSIRNRFGTDELEENNNLNKSQDIGDLNTYTIVMKGKLSNLQHKMSQFSQNLTSVQNGSRSFEDIKPNIDGIKNELTKLYNDINSLQPPGNLINIHNTVKEGCDIYLQGVTEFMKFYIDGNDEHFVTGGLKIQKGTELMYKAADMF